MQSRKRITFSPEEIKTKEEILREVFGEIEIAKPNSIYPNSVQRPRIYSAMDSYSSHLSERVKELEEENKNLRIAIDALDKRRIQIGNDRNDLKARIKELESQQQPVKESKYPNLEKGGHCEGTAP